MSRRYWLSIIAVIGIGLAGAVYAQPVGDDSRSQPSAGQAQEKPQGNETPRILDAINSGVERLTRALETLKPEPKGTREDERADDDLKAQQDMARWAKWMFWAALASAILTGFGLILLIGTLIYTKRAAVAAEKAVAESGRAATSAVEAAALARKAYIADHRTWLKINVVELGPVTFKDDKIGVRVVLQAENIGLSPAVEVHMKAEPYRARGIVVAKTAVDRMIAKNRRLLSLPSENKGMILMPGEKTANWSFSADAALDPDIEKRAAEIAASNPFPGKLAISVAYGVFYKSVASDEWLYSADLIFLIKVDNTDFDPAFGDVPTSNLRATLIPGNSQMA